MASTAATLVAKLMADTGQFDRALAGADRSLSGLGKAGGTAGALLKGGLAAGFAATVGGAGFAIKAAGDFEQSLNLLEATSGATDKQMQAISRTAKQLGADTKLPATSAKDAADAMLELSKGGLSVTQTMKAARGVLQLSAAAQIDNATAAGIVADALNSFGLSGKRAVDVADLLAASANASTADIDDMALALKQSSAVAASMDVPIETVVAALTEMANAGIKGSDAGTSLKTMLLSLAAPTDKAAKVMKDMGISVFDAHGKMKPFPQLVGDFERALGPMTDKQRAAALATIFGSDAIRAANVILGQGRSELEKTTQKVTEHGAAQKLAEAQTKGFNGAMEGFKSSLETLAITFGEKLLPAATAAIQWLTANLPKMVEVAGQVFGAIRDWITGTAVPAFQTFLDGVRAAVEWVRGNWPRIQPVFETVGNAIKQVWDGVIRPALDAFMRFVQSVVEDVQRNWPKIRETIRTVMDGVKTVIESTVNVLKSLWQRFGDDIKRIAEQAWNAVKGVIEGAADVIRGVVNVVVGVLTGDWKRAWDGAKTAVEGAWKAVKSVIDGAVGIISTAARAVGKAAVDAFKAAIDFVDDRAKTAFNAVKNAITGAVSGAVSAARNLGKSAIDGVVSGLSALYQRTKAAVFKVRDAIVAAAEAAFAWAVSIGSKIVSGVLSGLSSLASAVKSKIEGALSSALNAISPFSPIEEGARKLLGEPIVRGTLMGLAGLGSKVTRHLTAELGSGVGAISIAPAVAARLTAEQATIIAAAQQLGSAVVRGIAFGTVQIPDSISDRMRDALERARQRVADAQTSFRDAFSKLAGGFTQAFDAVTGSVSSSMQASFSAALAAFDRGTSAHMTATEKWISDQEAALRRTDVEMAAAQAQERVNKAIADGLEQGSSEFLQLLQARDRAELELTKLNSAERIAAEQAAWDEQRAAERAAIEASNKQAALDYESQRALQKEHLESRMSELATQLEKGKITEKQYQEGLTKLIGDFLPEYSSLGGLLGSGFVSGLDEKRSAAAGAATNVTDAVSKALFGSLWQTKRKGRDHGESFVDGFDNTKDSALESGEKVGRWLANGLASQAPAVRAGAKTLADAANEYLKLRSPAEKGPLSDLNTWWTPFVPTLLEGLDRDELARAVGKAAHPMGPLRPFLPFWPRPRPRPGGGGDGGVTVIVEGSVISERDLVETVRKGLIKTGQRSSTVLSGRGVTA